MECFYNFHWLKIVFSNTYYIIAVFALTRRLKAFLQQKQVECSSASHPLIITCSTQCSMWWSISLKLFYKFEQKTSSSLQGFLFVLFCAVSQFIWTLSSYFFNERILCLAHKLWAKTEYICGAVWKAEWSPDLNNKSSICCWYIFSLLHNYIDKQNNIIES